VVGEQLRLDDAVQSAMVMNFISSPVTCWWNRSSMINPQQVTVSPVYYAKFATGQ